VLHAPLPAAHPESSRTHRARAPRSRRAAHRAQACALYNNWWPLLTGVVYVLVPMPFLFLRGDTSDSYSLMGGDSDSWVDVAKFLTGAQ
jgi:hypothetical protein